MHTSHLFAQIPVSLLAVICLVSLIGIGSVDLRIASSIWLKYEPVSWWLNRCEIKLDALLDPVKPVELDPELFDDLDDRNDMVFIDEPNNEDLVDDVPFMIDEDLDDADFLELADVLPDDDAGFLNDFLDVLFDLDEDALDDDDDDANLPDLTDFSDEVDEPGMDVDLLFEVGLMNDSFILSECWDVLCLICILILLNVFSNLKNITKMKKLRKKIKKCK